MGDDELGRQLDAGCYAAAVRRGRPPHRQNIDIEPSDDDSSALDIFSEHDDGHDRADDNAAGEHLDGDDPDHPGARHDSEHNRADNGADDPDDNSHRTDNNNNRADDDRCDDYGAYNYGAVTIVSVRPRPRFGYRCR